MGQKSFDSNALCIQHPFRTCLAQLCLKNRILLTLTQILESGCLDYIEFDPLDSKDKAPKWRLRGQTRWVSPRRCIMRRVRGALIMLLV
jgi:hypothetical protein